MATVAELDALIDTLRAQKDSGVASITMNGRKVQYRDPAAIESAIADLVRRRDVVAGNTPKRRLIVSAGKGL